MASNKILFICPYPYDEAPSQRFRFEQYLETLKNKGYKYRIAPFLNKRAWEVLYTSGNSIQKTFWIITSFVKRITLILFLKPYEFVFIHREASPIGPPFFEWLVRYIWRKKIIYDFDDAIWLADPNEKGSLKALLKWKSKVRNICKWSYRVSVGNDYLGEFASEYNANIVINPTTIDTAYHKEIKGMNKDIITIGWTGTHSTLPYLNQIIPILDQLFKTHDFQLLVISNQNPEIEVPYIRFRKWQKATEIKDLNLLDIGIMPLTHDIWSQGKCGFKILQYMAINKPVVASPVGVNKKLLDESEAGFTAESSEQWQETLKKLLKNADLRKELGAKGKEYVSRYYSVQSNRDVFLSLFAQKY